jgi:hypothetical protein
MWLARLPNINSIFMFNIEVTFQFPEFSSSIVLEFKLPHLGCAGCAGCAGIGDDVKPRHPLNQANKFPHLPIDNFCGRIPKLPGYPQTSCLG